MAEYDNLDPAIACHWGPNAYGYIFVGDENILLYGLAQYEREGGKKAAWKLST